MLDDTEKLPNSLLSCVEWTAWKFFQQWRHHKMKSSRKTSLTITVLVLTLENTNCSWRCGIQHPALQHSTTWMEIWKVFYSSMFSKLYLGQRHLIFTSIRKLCSGLSRRKIKEYFSFFLLSLIGVKLLPLYYPILVKRSLKKWNTALLCQKSPSE